jgi:phosphoglycolate phosphatase-like HAD superfamily hydrolase
VAELVIFDCDGVLVDSDRISLAIQARHITALGLPMTAADCSREFLGIGMESTLEAIEARLGRPLPASFLPALEAEVEEAFRRELRPVPGVLAALEEIALPTCVASGGSQEKMRLRLGLTGLWERGQPVRGRRRQGRRDALPRLRRPDRARAARRGRRGLHRDVGAAGADRRKLGVLTPARAFPGSIPWCS